MNKKRNRSTLPAAYSNHDTIYKAMYITNQQRQSRMKKRKRVPTGADTHLITPYPLCSRYEFQTSSEGKDAN